MKTSFLLCSLLLPVAATAQKLVATAPPITYRVGSEKTFLYRTPADTAAGKSGFFLYPGNEAVVVGEFSPRWKIIKRQGFLYITPSRNLTIGSIDEKDSGTRAKINAGGRSEGFKILDAKNGFRNYHFGDEITKFPKLITSKGSEKHNLVIYTDPTENLKIGDASLQYISYAFYKGKLSSILIRTEGIENTEAVVAAFESLYGPGYQSNPASRQRGWFGQRVSMLFEEGLRHEGTFTMGSKELEAQEEADKKAAAKKAVSDL